MFASDPQQVRTNRQTKAATKTNAAPQSVTLDTSSLRADPGEAGSGANERRAATPMPASRP
jgi:hypothetical protein